MRHLGCLLAEGGGVHDVDAALAERALLVQRDLTWRQLALLAAVGRRDRSPLRSPRCRSTRGLVGVGALEDLTGLQVAGLLDPPVAVPRPVAPLCPGCGRPTCA